MNARKHLVMVKQTNKIPPRAKLGFSLSSWVSLQSSLVILISERWQWWMGQWWESKPSSRPLLPSLVGSRTLRRWPKTARFSLLSPQYIDSSKSECLNEADDHPYQHCLTRSACTKLFLYHLCPRHTDLNWIYIKYILLLLYLASLLSGGGHLASDCD